MLDSNRVREYLQSFNFTRLFIEELGWDRHINRLDVPVDGQVFNLTAVAQKKGMVAFTCEPRNDGKIPNHATRCKIERQVSKSVRQHLILYLDEDRATQIWQWVKLAPGKPSARQEHVYRRSKSEAALIEKLQAIAFSLAEKKTPAIADVTRRARKISDVERVTKRFYDEFGKPHAAFLKFIIGIPVKEDRQRYASVMLNRLMFVYFIQRKGFLDGEYDYLRNRLNRMKQEHGEDKCYSFYRYFLLRLFREGLGRKERTPELYRLLGRIPYLGGGLFAVHELEKPDLYGKAIQIPDEAFEAIFDYFDRWQWRLDERPVSADNEINPGVLGFIFEKYINYKQMGAYYSRDDITGYIGKNTVIPFLFGSAQAKCQIAFDNQKGATVWDLLKDEPKRYVYPALAHAMDKPLPADIAAGLDDVSQRASWNKPAPAEFALPTEIWREVVARRKRCGELLAKLASGEVRDINDFITLNLNNRQFAQDVIDNCEAPEVLRAWWQAILHTTILDPTCGAGDFLLAALKILEPLYEACLERMEAFVEDLDRSGEKLRSEKFSDFRKVLNNVTAHPNRSYFIFKSIISNNLFGVDIMEEAVEICKLRLFLKLTAQADPDPAKDNCGIEPALDIDFNIRAGNALVGYATADEARRAFKRTRGGQENSLLGNSSGDNQLFEDQRELTDRAFKQFRDMQAEHRMDAAEFVNAKQAQRERLKALAEQLNCCLAGVYGVKAKDKSAYARWVKSHQPFHWFVEFYNIVHQRGGFDVIIGNPPYVEYSKIRSEYRVYGYETENCGNLYAFVVERCFSIGGRKGWKGLIVPLSLMSTERMFALQELLLNQNRDVWFSAFDVYPCKLFAGAKQRLAIMLTSSHGARALHWSTRYNRWRPEEREHLFGCLAFDVAEYQQSLCVIPKLGCDQARSILDKLAHHKPVLFSPIVARPSFYVHRIPYNYVKAVDFVPYFWNEVDGRKKSEDYKPYALADADDAKAALAMLNSNLFFWWWYTLYEGYHCGSHEICSFPFGLEKMSPSLKRKLGHLADALMEDLKVHKNRKTCHYQTTGRVVYDELYPRLSKPLIDQIDLLLAPHYALREDEKDFVINFDIKYRTAHVSATAEFADVI